MNIQNTINIRGNSIEKASGCGYIIFILLLFFNKAAVGQIYNWETGDSPTKHIIKIYDGLKEIKVEVKMQYYIQRGINKYYRKENNKNKKFGEDFKIDETSVFKVKIELRSLKNSENVVLVIPSLGYVSTTGCFTRPKEDLKQPLKVYLNGNTELTFGIKPNYDGTSKINIDLEFEKNGKPLKKNLAGRKKQKKTTSVIIPIKTGLSKGRKDAEDKAWLDAHLAAIKDNVITGQINELIRISRQQKMKNRKNLLTKEIQKRVTMFFESTVLKTSCKEGLFRKFEDSDNFNYLSKGDQQKYYDLIRGCNKNIASQQDNTAYNSAKNDNTVKGYENYKKQSPNGAYIVEADDQIRKLKDTDNNAWDSAEGKANNTSNYCQQADAYEVYLKNEKNRLYRNLAKEKRDEAIKKCKKFRIEKRDEDVEKGEYIFTIKDGTAPFTYSITGNEDFTETSSTEFTIKILEGREYVILITGSSSTEDQSYTHNFKAQSPKFELIINAEEIIVKGGERPFIFETDDDLKKQFMLEEGRRILKQDLLKKLGMEDKVFNFLVRDAKERNTKSYNIEDGRKGGGSNWLIFLIIAGVITLLYFFRNLL